MTALYFGRAKSPLSCGIRALVAGCLSFLPLHAWAETRNWTNPSSGSWSVTGNWNGGTLPIGGDDIYITNSGTAIFVLGGPASSPALNNLYIGNGNLIISDPSNDHVQFTNATSYIGSDYSTVGAVTLNRSNAIWTSSQFFIGYVGTGTLSISGGATVASSSSQTSYVGYASVGRGVVEVSGFGSKWDNSTSSIHIGESGTGTVTITGGGNVLANDASLGSGSGSFGTIQVSGSSSQFQTSSSILVGEHGTGIIGITGGGHVKSNNIPLGVYANSSGTITISGSGSELEARSILQVGHQGSGAVIVSDGGKIDASASQVFLGDSGGASGTISISGAGSQLRAGQILIGNNGAGTITVTGGGSVQAGDTSLGAYYDSSGAISVSGSQSSWQSPYSLRVGLYGVAEVTVSDGGSIQVNTVTLAENSTSTGTINFGDYAVGTTSGTLTATAITFGSGTGTINFNQTNAVTLTTPVSGLGAVVQRGTGTTTFSTYQSYVGSTTVEHGTLLINSGLNSGNTVTVSEDGTLGGAGVIEGTTSVSGTLAPGSGDIGQLTVNTLSLNSTSVVVMEINNASQYDRLQIFGSLLVDDEARLRIELLDGFMPDEGDVFTLFAGSLPSFGIGMIDLPTLADGLFWNVSALDTTGQISVVPEPASFVLCLFALTVSAFWRRISYERP